MSNTTKWDALGQVFTTHLGILFGICLYLVPEVLALAHLLLLAQPVLLVLLRALVEELLIHLHEQLERIVNQSVNGPAHTHTHTHRQKKEKQTLNNQSSNST
jgi:hypothetical protein